MNGFYNEHTGDPKDGNAYCHTCGDQTPVGFKHHHAKDVPDLKKRLAEYVEDNARMDVLDSMGYEFIRWLNEREDYSSNLSFRDSLDEFRKYHTVKPKRS